MMTPCLDCGEPSDGPRCPEHRATDQRLKGRASREERGYDKRWRRLSVRARRLQRFCTDCGTTEDLTVDHSEGAWRRRAHGLHIRLEDVEVVCRACNARRGRARPSETRGVTPGQRPGPPAGESEFAFHISHSETFIQGGGI